MLALQLVRHFGITTGGRHTRPVQRVWSRVGLASLARRCPRSAGRRVAEQQEKNSCPIHLAWARSIPEGKRFHETLCEINERVQNGREIFSLGGSFLFFSGPGFAQGVRRMPWPWNNSTFFVSRHTAKNKPSVEGLKGMILLSTLYDYEVQAPCQLCPDSRDTCPVSRRGTPPQTRVPHSRKTPRLGSPAHRGARPNS